MKKEEFLNELKSRLSGLPKDEIEERISFYSEAIDDRIESGKTEEEAVKDIGSIDDVINDIAADTPLFNLVKEKIRPKRRIRGWEITLLILGFPLWFPLITVGLILFLVGYFILWILEFVLYVVDTALLVAAGGLVVAFLMALANQKLYVSYIGMSFLSIGLFGIILMVCIISTKGVIKLTKKNIIMMKSWFIRRK